MGSVKKRDRAAMEQSIAQEDWDFSSCRLDELQLCWSYEYSRQADWLVKKYEKERFTVFEPNGKDWWFPLCLDLKEPALITSQAWLPPGFPKKPFLSLETEFRRLPLPFELADDFMAHFPELDGRVVFLAETKEALNSKFCYPLYIDWSKNNRVIGNKFGKLLRTLRPEFFNPLETRGKSPIRKFEKELKALGAYRILKQEGTAPKAMKYTKLRLRSGHPLFATEGAWSRAKTTAEKVISEYFTRHG